MILKDITFYLTEECNFSCSYCYQSRGINTLDFSHIKNFFDYFYPQFDEECYVCFYGGEPLLYFNKIYQTIDYLESNNHDQKKFIYCLTTNGSLFNKSIISYLQKKRFHVILSFDGLNQDTERHPGTSKQILEKIKEIVKFPGIQLEISSVFTPETVASISKSMQHIIAAGVPNVNFSPSMTHQWGKKSRKILEAQLQELMDFSILYFKSKNSIPIQNFRNKIREGLHVCTAGQDRLVLAPDGTLWGCFLIRDYFTYHKDNEACSNYCFGNIDSFIKSDGSSYSEIIRNYRRLRQENFFTPQTLCRDCPEKLECTACPADAAFTSSFLGYIPDHLCQLYKILRETRKIFWEKIENQKTKDNQTGEAQS